MAAPGDTYEDLADATWRGVLEPGRRRSRRRQYGDLRTEFIVSLGPWERMLTCLLEDIAEDVGSVGRGLSLLEVPTPALVCAWLDGPTIGTKMSVRWLAERSLFVAAQAPVRRTRSRRGDTYCDLVDSVRSFRARGDGRLDPARLRCRYTISLRRSWMSMVGDLLGAVVADAGNIERASPVLEVGVQTLAHWVCWLVSRGSNDAAWSTWPLGHGDSGSTYLDLVEAIERGALRGDGELELPRLRDHYSVSLDSWERIKADLLLEIVADAGSVRRAAQVLDIPRSTLGAWLLRTRMGRLCGGS